MTTRAPRDANHFAALFDRLIQNLRRYLGYDVQYFAVIEPQKRLAPHAFSATTRDWISERPDLRAKTVELYRYLLRRHLDPTFEAKSIADIKEPHIRRWGAVKRSPCRIKCAGQEHSPERPVLTIAQVYAVANAGGQRYQALVLLAMFSSLRRGELAALFRCDIDLEARTRRASKSGTTRSTSKGSDTQRARKRPTAS